MTKYTPAQKRAVSKYMDEKIDSVRLYLPKGRKDEIKAHAQAQGESMNGFIIRAITETMKRDKRRKAPLPPLA